MIFPGYEMMEKCYEKWKSDFSKLKATYIENRDKQFSDQNIKNYFKNCKSKKGAILFAVARGNYSEGYNFKGKSCRGLIMIGVPNLNMNSPKIKMKYLYLSKF